MGILATGNAGVRVVAFVAPLGTSLAGIINGIGALLAFAKIVDFLEFGLASGATLGICAVSTPS